MDSFHFHLFYPQLFSPWIGRRHCRCTFTPALGLLLSRCRGAFKATSLRGIRGKVANIYVMEKSSSYCVIGQDTAALGCTANDWDATTYIHRKRIRCLQHQSRSARLCLSPCVKPIIIMIRQHDLGSFTVCLPSTRLVHVYNKNSNI